LFSSHSRRSPARFLASSMSHELIRTVFRVDGHFAPGGVFAAPMVVSRNCKGLISPKPLKRVTTGLVRGDSEAMRFKVFSRSASSRGRPVEHFLAGIDAKQGWHADIDVAGAHQRR